jgi:glycerophosphoryl diester phosphodiesterase
MQRSAMEWTVGAGGLRIGGHRGAAAVAPENTMTGFVLAAQGGADYLELDVRMTSDGVAIVFHDDDLSRTTDGAGPPEALTLADLRRLDAGSWFGRTFIGERIPTLDEVLAFIEELTTLGATIEAKGAGTGAVIAAAIDRSSAGARLSTCSFEPAELRAVAQVRPDVPRLLIADRDDPDADPVVIARAAQATGVNLPLEWLDARTIDRLHAAGLLVAGGTVDDEAGIRRALALGVDVVDSNDPAAVVAIRDALSRGR